MSKITFWYRHFFISITLMLISDSLKADPDSEQVEHSAVFLAVYPFSSNSNIHEWTQPKKEVKFCVPGDETLEEATGYGESSVVEIKGLFSKPASSSIKKPKENNRVRKAANVIFPIASLLNLAYHFSHADVINAEDGSFLEYYDSLLVLGGSNHLADGVAAALAEMLSNYNISVTWVKGTLAIIIFIPAEWAAFVRGDQILNSKELTFSQAANYFAFKSTSNQVNYVSAQLSTQYIASEMGEDTDPVLKEIVSKALGSSLYLSPWILKTVYKGIREKSFSEKKLYLDSTADFLVSTYISALKVGVQQGVHHFLDGHKDPDSNEGFNNKIDESQVVSEIMTSGFFFGLGVTVDTTIQCMPMSNPVKYAAKTVGNHFSKTSTYAIAGAIKKTSRQYVETEASASLITFFSTVSVSFIASKIYGRIPERTGHAISSMNQIYFLGSELTMSTIETFAIAFGFIPGVIEDETDYSLIVPDPMITNQKYYSLNPISGNHQVELDISEEDDYYSSFMRPPPLGYMHWKIMSYLSPLYYGAEKTTF